MFTSIVLLKRCLGMRDRYPPEDGTFITHQLCRHENFQLTGSDYRHYLVCRLKSGVRIVHFGYTKTVQDMKGFVRSGTYTFVLLIIQGFRNAVTSTVSFAVIKCFAIVYHRPSSLCFVTQIWPAKSEYVLTSAVKFFCPFCRCKCHRNCKLTGAGDARQNLTSC